MDIPDNGGAGPNIIVTRWSTAGIPPEQRFESWSARPFPSLAQLFEIVPLEPFETQADHILLGGMVLQFGEGTARSYHRSVARAQRDGIDMLGISLLLTGHIEGEADGQPFRAGRQAVLLLDLTRPSRFVFSQAASIQMAVPRALAERHLGAFDDLHGMVIAPSRTTLLLKHLQSYRKALPVLKIAHGPLLAGIILDLLAIAINRSSEAGVVHASTRVSAARIAAERVIESRLHDPSLSVEQVCAATGISRSNLYRLFEPDGGFKNHVKRRRLEQVRLALADVAGRDPIGHLAKRWGFKNPSHLSRLFQAQFGVGPREYRQNPR